MRLFVSALLLVAAGAMQSPALPEISERVWAKPDHFWWRRSLPGGGHLWLTVDARHGAKTPLFDHQRLAIELNLRTGYEFTPTTLPFADPAARFVVKYDGSNAYIQEGAMAVEFVLDGQQWRCDLQIKWDWNKRPPTDYECLPRRPAAPAAPATPAPNLSPDRTWRAFVRDHNVWIEPAGGGQARALTTDGKAGDAYDPGSIRWSKDSRRLDAYRLNEAIWTSQGVSGNVREHVVSRTFPIEDRQVTGT